MCPGSFIMFTTSYPSCRKVLLGHPTSRHFPFDLSRVQTESDPKRGDTLVSNRGVSQFKRKDSRQVREGDWETGEI